jgi:hypothetical protein
MIDRQLLRKASGATGLLFEGSGDAKRFLGSCFCLVEPRVFLTAAHCLSGTEKNMWVNHSGGPPPDLMTPVRRVEYVREADLAVFETDVPDARWDIALSQRGILCGFQ